MPLSEPAWWYARNQRLEARLFAPISHVYGWAARRRIERATPYRARLPVVCIGNLTAGGTGKTPLSLRMADEIEALGRTPIFLTRGYGGQTVGPRWADRARDTAAQIGDETLLLAARARTMVARKRDVGARAIEADAPDNAVVIMDDGLQNPALLKDFSIAVINGARGLGNGRVIPAGPLRAPAAFQAGLVDCFIINDTTGLPSVPVSSDPSDPIMQLAAGKPVLHAHPEPIGPTAWLSGTRVLAFAGIAHPQRFFAMLKNLGADIVETRIFNDHEPIDDELARNLMTRAELLDARLITTAKDLARLRGTSESADRLANTVRCLTVRLTFDEGDVTRVRDLLTAALAQADARRAASGEDA